MFYNLFDRMGQQGGYGGISGLLNILRGGQQQASPVLPNYPIQQNDLPANLTTYPTFKESFLPQAGMQPGPGYNSTQQGLGGLLGTLINIFRGSPPIPRYGMQQNNPVPIPGNSEQPVSKFIEDARKNLLLDPRVLPRDRMQQNNLVPKHVVYDPIALQRSMGDPLKGIRGMGDMVQTGQEGSFNPAGLGFDKPAGNQAGMAELGLSKKEAYKNLFNRLLR